MKKTIYNYNSKGEWHGHQEWYYNNGMLGRRGTSKNTRDIGYNEWHSSKRTIYSIR
jgi:hypothetical protein